MRRILYLTAITISLGVSTDAFAQGGGGSFGGSGGAGGSSFGGGGGSSFGGGGTSLGGSSGLSSGGSSFSGSSGGQLGGGSAFSGSSGGQLGGGSAFSGSSGGGTSFGGGTGGGRGAAGGSGGFTISQTNPFAGTYSNPLYYGRPGGTTTSMGAGGTQLRGAGFGQPSYGTVTTTSVTTTGAGGLAGRTGTATVGNRGMTGGIGGGIGGANSTPQVSYMATVGFAGPPMITPVVRADLQGLLNRSSALSRPGTLRVEAAGDVIVLRGRVANEDEKRLVEGMVRLEPGVHEVRNELEVGP
jgi:hypothetical protein